MDQDGYLSFFQPESPGGILIEYFIYLLDFQEMVTRAQATQLRYAPFFSFVTDLG